MKGFVTTSASFWLCALSVSSSTGTAAQSVYEAIALNPELSLFANALAAASYDDPESSILMNETQNLTVFVPSNAAVENYAILKNYSDHPGWDIHLKELIDLHIVAGSALPLSSIFNFNNGETSTLDTLGGPVEVSIRDSNYTVAGQNLFEGAIVATNGIVHVVSGVFPTVWRGASLNDKAAFSAPVWGMVAASGGFGINELETLTPFGTTLLAASDDVFKKKQGGDLLQALLNASATDETYDILLYNVIDENLYSQEIFDGIQYLVTPRSEKAQMWVTMDETNKLRFNDAVVEETDIAENG